MTRKEESIASSDQPTKVQRLDALIRLYSEELQRQKQIEAIQWRINFAVWTFIVLAAHALQDVKIHHHWRFVLGLAALAFLHFVAIVKNIRSIVFTRDLWRKYRASADELLYPPERLPLVVVDEKARFASQYWWVATIFGTTVLLGAVGLVLIW